MFNSTENTSGEAFQAIQPKLPSLRDRVFTVIQNAGANGVVMEDVYNAIPDAGYVLHQRASELVREGRVVVSGIRKNSRGKNQKVWTAVEAA